MAVSYSFHISSKGHSIGTIGKVGQVSKHNLRAYKSDEYDRDMISVLSGSETSILDSVKEIYEDEFSGALEEYNSKKRDDRQIKDYLEHVSQSRNDVAAEIIIQIGDKDFWQDKTPEQFRSMDKIFKEQLRDLEKILPAFKIASAVVHYDESSPHMHVVGVPVAKGGTRGMKKQCVKTKVFTKESLAMLQNEMRLKALQYMDSIPELFAGTELKEKKKGRNKDLPKYMMDELTTAEKELLALKTEIDTLSQRSAMLKKDVLGLKADKSTLQKQIAVLEGNLDVLEADERILIQKFIANPSIKELFEKYHKTMLQKIQNRPEQRKSIRADLSRYQSEVDSKKQQQLSNPGPQRKKRPRNKDQEL